MLHYKASKSLKFLWWGSCLDINLIQQNKKGSTTTEIPIMV